MCCWSWRHERCLSMPSINVTKGRGLGEFLLIDAHKRALKQSPQIAAAAAVVDAIDEKAAGFYQHFGFMDFPNKPGRFFLPMKTIANLFTSS